MWQSFRKQMCGWTKQWLCIFPRTLHSGRRSAFCLAFFPSLERGSIVPHPRPQIYQRKFWLHWHSAEFPKNKCVTEQNNDFALRQEVCVLSCFLSLPWEGQSYPTPKSENISEEVLASLTLNRVSENLLSPVQEFVYSYLQQQLHIQLDRGTNT